MFNVVCILHHSIGIDRAATDNGEHRVIP